MSRGPWKKKNVLLAGEMQDEGAPEIDLTEDEANALVPVPEPVEPVAPAPVAPASFTMTAADLQNMVTAAVSAAAAGNAQLADAVTKGIADAREPIPENKFSPGISVFNPLGDQAHPRPDLKCEFFYGTMDAKTKIVSRTYPLLVEDLTVMETIALNTLEPQNAVIKLHDGSSIKVSLVPELDPATDELTRMVIVVPQTVIGKGSALKNMLPGPCNIVAQLTGIDYEKLSREDLAWFMAEHRAKRYVSVRESVAA